MKVRDALVWGIGRVRADARPTHFGPSLVAVFDGEPAEGRFVGLVTTREVARFPQRIFADMLPRRGNHGLRAEAPIEDAVHSLAQSEAAALPVLGSEEEFVGAVTRESILEALLADERSLRTALDDATNKVRATLDALPDLVVRWDLEGRCVESFAGAAERAPTAPRPLPGCKLEELFGGSAGHEMLVAIRACLASNEPLKIVIGMDTERRRLEYEIRLVPFDKGSVLSLMRDATEMNELKAQLVFMERMAAMGTLAAGVAHEINNPLTYVFSCAESIREALADSSSAPVCHESIEGIIDGASRIAAIVRDLRGFGRPEAETRTPVDVNASVRSAINLAMPHVRAKARFSAELEASSPVSATESRLAQVFLNLLVNAAQAIPEGAALEHSIRVITRDEGTQVRIIVEDTGPGLDSAARKHLFEAFFSTKPKDAGTGLGLFICNNIVSDLGGTILVDTPQGGGTSFHVLLPSLPTIPPVEAVVAQAGRPARGARILLVDDEPLVLSAVASMLAVHDLVADGDPHRALHRIAEGESFDVIIADLMMPAMTGIELFAEVCRLRPALAPRFMFITGGAFTEECRSFIHEHHERVLHKPFSRAELREFVDNLLARTRNDEYSERPRAPNLQTGPTDRSRPPGLRRPFDESSPMDSIPTGQCHEHVEPTVIDAAPGFEGS